MKTLKQKFAVIDTVVIAASVVWFASVILATIN